MPRCSIRNSASLVNKRSQFHHSGNPNYYRVMLCTQHQAAVFFQNDGATVIRPPSTDLWETPTSLPLATDTYYLPRHR